jgi:putative redox protein
MRSFGAYCVPSSDSVGTHLYNGCVAEKPPTVVDLNWIGELKFTATTNQSSLTLDSSGQGGPSPVDALAAALAGCMTTDVVHILNKGRHPVRSVTAHLVADRASSDPHRFVRVTLHVIVAGDVPAHAIERAIALSRDTYCSVWHSMRSDIEFTVTFETRVH